MFLTVCIILILLILLFLTTIYCAIRIASMADDIKGDRWKQEEIFFIT